MFIPLLVKGPEETFESRVFDMGLPDDAEKDRRGNRNVACEYHPGQELSAGGNEM